MGSNIIINVRSSLNAWGCCIPCYILVLNVIESVVPWHTTLPASRLAMFTPITFTSNQKQIVNAGRLTSREPEMDCIFRNGRLTSKEPETDYLFRNG